MNNHFLMHIDELEQELAQEIAVTLDKLIAEKGEVCLALSGGRSPIGMLELLSNKDIAWEKVAVTLVDERWVSSDSEESNEHLLRHHFLKNKASKARFIPIWKDGLSSEEGADLISGQWNNRKPKAFVAVLGMGLDGHIASLFPNTPMDVRKNPQPFVATTAPVVPVNRVSMTLSLLETANVVFLQWTGSNKHHVYQDALKPSSSSKQFPVIDALNLPNIRMYGTYV